MKRLNGALGTLAILLAALLPLEQAHCLFMPLQAGPTQCAPASTGAMDHSCCAPSPAPAAQPQHGEGPTACPCFDLPSGTVPQSVVATPHLLSSQVVLFTMSSLAAPRAATAPAPALDVGTPPVPIAVDAHGLRAPPLSA